MDTSPHSSTEEHLICNEGVGGSNPSGGSLTDNDPSLSVLKGDITTAIVMVRLLSRGYVVLQPWGVSHRYDLVIDDNGKFSRVQCKTGRLKPGVVEFNSSNTYWYGKSRHNYKGQIEYFGVHSFDLNKTYLVPVGIASETVTKIRVEPTKNGQTKGIIWASSYEI